MRTYEHLTDQELADKLARYREAEEALDLGEGVAVIAGEGRRQEFTAANSDRLTRIIRALVREQDYRAGRAVGGRAIEVWF